MEDGSCGQDPEERLHRVDVTEDTDALAISVWMREEQLEEGTGCAGVGIDFVWRMALDHPIGERGIIDAGYSKGEPWEVELEPRDPGARRRLRGRYDVFN